MTLLRPSTKEGSRSAPVILVMVAGAGDVPAMRAASLVRIAAGTAGQPAATAAGADGVHWAGPGRGQGGEHARMRGHGLGDALAAGQV